MKTIGFIGQGWIGKNYADDFEKRGYPVIRYSQEKPYRENREKIAACDIVFIAVPTPTTPEGFSDGILREVLPLVGKGKIAVIKSTVLPGVTEALQKENSDIFVLHSPEFLTESSAAHDAAHPKRNIIGIPIVNELYQKKAQDVLEVLPNAPFTKICKASEAEIIKYSRNGLGFVRVVFTNMLYDVAKDVGADWDVIREAISADPDNGPTYANPVHKNGRGAGGHCFIKDFHAFTRLYEAVTHDKTGTDALKFFEEKNNELLITTEKDIDLLMGVIGEEKVKAIRKKKQS
jgi:nucleotide sugar dehydrogenase